MPDIGISDFIQFSTLNHHFQISNLSYEPFDASFWRKCLFSALYVIFIYTYVACNKFISPSVYVSVYKDNIPDFPK